MENFKGTKGEWKVSKESGVFLNEHGVETMTIDIADAIYCIDVYADKRNENFIEELEANAKLIASAPDLLEACNELLELLSFHEYNHSTEIYKAKKAIEKALK